MKVKKKEIIKCCLTCDHCVYIGEGDSICDVDEPVLILSDFEPTDMFNCCNECDWEPQE